MWPTFIAKQFYNRIVFLFLVFLSLNLSVAAQGGFSSTSETQFTIDTISYIGYKSYFEYPTNEVLKGFWNYTKSFGHGVNMRSYYRLVIPQTDSSNTSLTLIGKPEGEGSTCLFSLGMDLSQLNTDPIAYKEQLRIMLMEFKIDMYLNSYQDEINSLVKDGKKLSKQHQKALKKGQIYQEENAARLSRLHAIEQQIEQLRNKQVQLLAALKKVKG
jgi:hypothetical protein